MNIIPPIHYAGIYEVFKPFVLIPDTIYSCTGLVDFTELTDRGIDAYQIYYATNGIARSVYERDVKNGVVIVTLKAQGRPSVTLPSSYIKSLPDVGFVPYNVFILSVAIPAPDDTDFEGLKEAMRNTVETNFGVADATINITQAPTRKYMTTEDAKIAEANRLAAISDVHTLHTENGRLNNQIQALHKQIEAMMALSQSKA